MNNKVINNAQYIYYLIKSCEVRLFTLLIKMGAKIIESTFKVKLA